MKIQIKQNINIIILIIILLMSAVLVGTPLLPENVQIVYIILGIYSIIYFGYKVIKKEKVEIDKIDIFVMILTISSIIPLVARTYVSLSSTVYGILRSFALLSVYLIIKSECRKNGKSRKVIAGAVVTTTLILSIIGIDEIKLNLLKDIKTWLNYIFIQYDEVRIGSLFAYANAMAIVAGVGLLLCLGNIVQTKKWKIRILNIVLSIVLAITLILTYSRLVYIIFAIVLFIYCIILLRKVKINKKLSRVLIISGIVVITLATIYIVIGLQLSTKVVVNGEYQKILYSANPNTDYVLEFDMTSKIQNEENIIKITEKNKYFDDVNTTEYRIGDFEGVKKIEFHTKEQTAVMYINIRTQKDQGTIEIRNCKMNNENFILKYKLLPTQIVDKIKSISLKNKSAFERIVIIQDGLKLVQQSWLFGLGDNAWNTSQEAVHQYNYSAQEMHSWPVKIFIENGIVGIIAYIGIVVLVLKQLIHDLKNKKLSQMNIYMAIILLLLHGLVDFDMSFFYILLVFFSLLATIEFNDKKVEVKYGDTIYIIIIAVSIINIYVSAVGMHYKKNKDQLKVDSKYTEQVVYEIYNKLLPFDRNIKMKRIRILENAEELSASVLKDFIQTEKYYLKNTMLDYIEKYINKVIKEEKYSELDFALDYIKETEEFSIYSPNIQIGRLNNIQQIVKDLKEAQLEDYAKKFEEQLKKEVEEKEKYILDFEKARYEERQVEIYQREINKLK